MAMRYATTITGQTAPLLACTLLVLAGVGCATTPRSDAPTRADRLMGAYEELAQGRFLTLADFETPETLKLCRIEDASGRARIVLDAKRGRKETGGGALRFTTAGDGDVLTIGGGHDPGVYMKRDWRPYDLLLMSIHSPRAGIGVRVGLSSGPAGARRSMESPIQLDRGWNLLKFDLAEVAERIPLDDVRRIDLSAFGVDRPIDLLVDDLILTAHRELLMGDPRGAPGALYVIEVGRRWRVGVTGGFEIGFHNGQIVEWFEPASDPTRLRNFVGGTVLGPTIVSVGAPTIEGGGRTIQRTRLGDDLRSSQEIVEQSALRVVIECRFEGAAASSDKDAQPPVESYRYTIYPSGHVYTKARRRMPTEQQSSPRSGICFSIVSDDRVNVITRTLSRNGHQEEWATYASFSSATGGPSALMVVPATDATEAFETWHDPEHDRLNLLAQPDRPLAAVQEWRSAMRLGSAPGQPTEEVQAEVAAMCRPPLPRIEVGHVGAQPPRQSPSPGDNADGCIALTPEHGYLRFVLDEAWPAGMTATYVIEQSENREATVYVNHLIHDRIARDGMGRLLVQLPAGAAGIRVEILLRAHDSTSRPGFDTR